MIASSQGWPVPAPSSRALTRRRKRRSLLWAITLPFVLLVLFSVTVVGNLVVRQGIEASQLLAGQLQEEVGDRAIGELRTWIKKPLMLNQLNAEAFQQGVFDLNQPEAVVRQLSAQLEAFPELAQMMVVDSQGRSVRALRQKDMVQIERVSQLDLAQPGANPKAIDLRQSPWYQEAAKTQKRIWHKAFEEGVAIAALPIFDAQQQLQQVVATGLDLSLMDQFLDEIQLTDQGQAFVLDKDGLLLSTSSAETPYRPDAQGKMIGMQARDSQNPMTQAVVAYLQPRWNQIPEPNAPAPAKAPVQAAIPVQLQLPFGDDLLWIQARRYQPYPGADWLIAAVIPQSDLLGPIQARRNQTLLLCGLLLLLSLLLCAALARHLVGPVRRLRAAAQALSQGNWENTLPSPLLNRSDELGDLAQSFDHMGQELQRSFQQLEEQNQQLATQNKTLEEQKQRLQELDRLKDEFLANTSHELRTPLSGILGLAEALQAQTQAPLSPPQREALELIIISAQRLSVLVNDILDLSKLENHALQLNCVAFDLHTLVQHVLALCQPLAEPCHLQLINQVSATLPPVFADAHRVQQIFYNLVGNAIKFTPQGQVAVAAQVDSHSPSQGSIKISVTDTGIGMDAETQQRIFNAFEQGTGEITRIYGGAGLGLTVSKALIELHGGTIEVRSRPNQGSQFCFTLPLADANGKLDTTTPLVQNATALAFLAPLPRAMPRATGLQEGAQATAKSTKTRILIVDDDLTNLHVLQAQLAAEPYEIVQAATGEQALELLDPLRGESFDLVILDVMMPLISGYDVCRKLRHHYPIYQLPVIMLTAKVQVEDVVAGFQAGANDYLKKPFSREELLSRLETHLSNRLYGRFVPEHFLKFLEKSSISEIRLGNQVSCDMTVMFSDIRGFASLSEAMTPQQNFDFVNDYLRRVSPEIRDHEGFIVKYLGDGMMAIFPQRPEDAIKAGIAKLRQVEQFNRDRHPLAPIQIGIGIHYGPMMVGIVGETKRMQGDAFSDDVNLASRLEGLTKFYGVSLVISEQVLEQLGDPSPFQLRQLDQVMVQGRLQPLTIYEVFDGDEPAMRDRKTQTRHRFEAGIACYQAARFSDAQAHFQAVLTQNPGDRPAQIYARWVEDCLETPPPPDWTGVSNWGRK